MTEENLENDALMERLAACNSPEELANMLEANSLVLEDGLSIEKAFELLKRQANGELDAAELNSVSGGMKLGFTVASAAKAGVVKF